MMSWVTCFSMSVQQFLWSNDIVAVVANDAKLELDNWSYIQKRLQIKPTMVDNTYLKFKNLELFIYFDVFYLDSI